MIKCATPSYTAVFHFISFHPGHAWNLYGNNWSEGGIKWQRYSRHVNEICCRLSRARRRISIQWISDADLRPQETLFLLCFKPQENNSRTRVRQKPLRTPVILFIHLQASPGKAPLPREGNVKQAVLRGPATLPRPRGGRYETGHGSLWSRPPPEGLTDLRRHKQGFVWKQTTGCAAWSTRPCWEARARTSRGRFDAVSLSRSDPRYGGFEFPGPSWSRRKGVHQRRSHNVALPVTDATLTLHFISLSAAALQNRLETWGRACTIWVMRYV